MTFVPLQTSMCESDPVAGAEVQRRRPCSPRSMYSLATAVSVSYGCIAFGADVLKAWDPGHQGGCAKGHPIPTFYRQHCARTVYFLRCKVCIHQYCPFVSLRLDLFSHKAVMDMEIQFLHENFTEKDPRLLMGHIQRMASGEAPFFSTTLGLVYEKLVEKTFARPVPSGSGLGNLLGPGVSRALVPPSSDRFLSPVFLQPPPPAEASSSGPESGSVSSGTPPPSVWLQCIDCSEPARIKDLYDGLRCPECPPTWSMSGARPYMRCSLCRTGRLARTDNCARRTCRARFV